MRHHLTAVALALLATDLRAAAPTCALLDPDKTPRAALLEAKLQADPGPTWVERADIDKVLAEQKLQVAFGPQGVGDRVKLGNLLKADLLVMVRPVKAAEQPAIEVVVSETASGLRLLMRAVPVTKDADADVAALLAAARDGIRKYGERATVVVAVPPFVSHNLEFTHDHLKGALAKLAEAEALDRKGVVVVELEEAEALAKEIALAAPGSKIDRPLPVYLWGEYRHTGKGKDLSVGVKLRAERGGKPVAKAEVLTLKPDEAPAEVRKWSAGVLDAVAKDDRPRPPADPKAEAKTLAERARIFSRLGNWPEAFALTEASLLLDPNQNELRVEALRVLGPLMQQSWNSFSPKIEEVRRVRPLYSRGLEHLEIATFRDELLSGTNGVPVTGRFLHAGSGLYCATAKADVQGELADMRRERREVLLRMLPDLAKRGKNEEVNPIRMITAFMPPKEHFAQVEQLIIQFQEFPNAAQRTIFYAELVRPELLPFAPYVRANEDAEYRAFLDQLAGAKNADVRSGAAQLKTRWDAAIVRTRAVDAGTTAAATNEVSLKPIGLTFVGEKVPYFDVGGITAAGPGVDVVWGNGALYLMKEKGKLKRVWAAKEQSVYFAAVCFDGRYVWVATRRHQRWGTLLILDPASEKVREVTGADGLPEGSPEQLRKIGFHNLLVAPVEPGRACVAGSFGRTWVATVAFHATTGKATVKVIHEAREAQDPRDAEQAARTTIDFCPTFLVALRSPTDPAAKPEVRVVLGRGKPLPAHGTPCAAVTMRPLVVNPDKPGVDVAASSWGGLPTEVSQHQFLTGPDVLYFTRPVASTPTTPQGAEVLRVGLPDLTPRGVVRGLPVGTQLAFAHENRLHAIQSTDARPGPDGRYRNYSNWWIADADGKNLRQGSSSLPVIESAHLSSHYGLVALAGADIKKPRTLNTVEFAPPKK